MSEKDTSHGSGAGEPGDRLTLLIDAYLHGELSPEGLAELEDRLKADPQAVALFSEVTEQASMMREVYGSANDQLVHVEDGETDDFLSILSELGAAETEAVEVAVDLTDEAARRERIRRHRARRDYAHMHRPRSFTLPRAAVWLGMAAVLGLAAFVIVRVNQTTPTQPTQVERQPGTPEAAPVAEFLAGFDTHWMGNAPTSDRQLPPGRYTLSHGWGQVRTRYGVDLLLEGPVTFELSDENKLTLIRGQLVAEVPATARGFVIQTPGGRVTDHGATFGISVKHGGETLAHVFAGEAVVTAISLAAGGAVRLTSNQAASVVSDAVRRVDAAPERFSREVPATAYQAAVLESRPMCYWRGPIDESTSLLMDHGWLNAHGQAAGSVRNDRAGFVPEDPSGSLEFRGLGNSAISIPYQDQFALEGEFTIEVWCWIDPGHDGFLRILSTRGARGGIGLGVNGEGELSIDSAPRNVPVLTFFGLEDIVGESSLPEGQWTHLVATVDHRGRARLFIDGVETPVHTALGAVRQDDGTREEVPLMLGRNPYTGLGAQGWQGRLDEIALYNRALTQDEIITHLDVLRSP